ncbi:hypothetical protein EVAR_77216_1 [Eumeta japonica]|uniref:Uncharacterized protein n=1 Tax=Eumeta variegata TaxID=151549 RepID=A0A4C1T513_EUMVA|nr:hypothetical protein EVAR_77216_1 [Eumeta japonica]
MSRELICESLLKRNKAKPFVKRLITDNEKWISYQRQELVKKIMVKSGLRPTPMKAFAIFARLLSVRRPIRAREKFHGRPAVYEP